MRLLRNVVAPRYIGKLYLPDKSGNYAFGHSRGSKGCRDSSVAQSDLRINHANC